jgi:hypothetical protein
MRQKSGIADRQHPIQDQGRFAEIAVKAEKRLFETIARNRAII